MLWWLAQSSVTAAALAGIVAVVCRLGRLRPAVRHALWLLVLLKLLTPPLFAWHVPLPHWERHFHASTGMSPSVPNHAVSPQPEVGGADRSASGPRVRPGESDRRPDPPVRPEGRFRPAAPTVADQTEVTGPAAPAAETVFRDPAWLAGGLWLGGAAVGAFMTAMAVRRVRKLLVWQQAAPEWLVGQLRELAARLRVRPPRALLLPGITSPFLWCLGRPKLLLPAALMGRLSADCRRAVLVHELAHLRRRDHWVSWLQVAALCLWWWNPLFWIVRRQLRDNAELACDAWVVHTLPGCRRAYAETLLEVCRLMTSPPAPGPVLGMGSRGRRTLEGRLTMILQDRGSCRVPLPAVVAVGLLALVVLPAWSPGQKTEPAKEADKARADKRERDLETALRTARVNGKYAMLLRQLHVPEDADNYTAFNDFGVYQGTSYAGQNDLPPGYWVYVEPYWYIWRDLSATPKAKRAWGPEQATGAPDTDGAGDLQTAWASRTPDGQDEWLLLEYAEPVVPREVHVYETFNPGALYKVSVFKLDGTEVEVWRGQDPTPVGSDRGISKVPVKVNFKTNRVKIYLASKEVPGWNEIDAVGVVDAAGKTHWAKSADASSTYAEPTPLAGLPGGRPQGKRPWGPEQVIGPPDTPEAGDFGTAWASLTPDGQDEWLQTEYAEEVTPKEVHVYETFNPGALYRVSVFKPDGTEVEVWNGKDPTPVGSGKGVSVIPIKVNFKTKRVKIYLASKEVPGWNEIDAIGVKDTANAMHWAVSATASSTYAQAAPPMADAAILIAQEQLAAQQQMLAALERENRKLKETIRKLKATLDKGGDDQEFVRRVYLDLTGKAPTEKEVRDFVQDKKADKRQRLIDRLTTAKGPRQQNGR